MSLFVDAEEAPIRWAADVGADRVELYTEPFARAFERGADAARDSFASTPPPRSSRTRSAWASTPGTTSTSRIWSLFRTLPHLDEVSIGHALISHALFVGLDRSVREYLSVPGGDLRSGFGSSRTSAERLNQGQEPVRSSMKAESIAFAIAGMCFGVILGWVLGDAAGPSSGPGARGAGAPAAAGRGR